MPGSFWLSLTRLVEESIRVAGPGRLSTPKPAHFRKGEESPHFMGDRQHAFLRKQLVDAMSGHQAHADFDSVVSDFPAEIRGTKPDGAPHTAWELLEHMRIAQHDVLEFSRNPKYESPKWPDGYWPKTEAPPDEAAWDASIQSFKKDARELDELVTNPEEELFKPFEQGEGQTLLKEALLVATHNSYHLGQLMYLKKMLLSKR